MTLTRVLSRVAPVVGAVVLGGVLTASTYGAPAAPARHGQHAVVDHFQPPMVHKYGINGMRMGLHCETTDLS